MAIRDIFRVNRKTFIDPKGWLDYRTLQTQTRAIRTILRDLFSKPKPRYKETFEEAVARLNLTEDDIQGAIKGYRQAALLLAGFGFLILFYSFYLLFAHGTFLGWLLGLTVMSLSFSYAFKYDFWAFQMQRRKLGLTFSEWKRHIFGEKGAG